jgi:proteasome lid subunit RPN8/RPN11
MTTPRRRFVVQKMVQQAVEEVAEDLDRLPAEFAIHCPRKLLGMMMGHAMGYANTEVFGLLLGRPVMLPGRRLRTIIEDFVPAEVFLASDACYVEVSSQELFRMHDECEVRARARNLQTAGWFHTHPGHGIFMSRTDRDNHRIYTHPWQVALVLDPQRNSWGFFAGTDCREVPREHVVLEPESSAVLAAAAIPEPPVEPVEEPPVPSAPAKSSDEVVAGPPPEGTGDQAPEKAEDQPKRAGTQLFWSGLAIAAGLLVAIALLFAKLTVQQSLLEEENARLRDLQVRIEELSKLSCVQE